MHGQPFTGWMRGRIYRRWKVGVVGALAGLMNGLIGMGGGTIVVPGLVWARDYPPKKAVVTSLCAVLLLSVFSLTLHSLLTGLAFHLHELLLLALTGILGAQFGARALIALPNRWVFLLFAGFCLFCAQYLFASALGWVAPLFLRMEQAPTWGILLIGLLSGFSSGLLGIGGGLIAILGLTLTFNTPLADAVTVALAMNIANALSGLLQHAWSKRIDTSNLRDVAALVPAALAGAAMGSLLSAHLPGQALRIVFGLFVVYVGATMYRKGMKEGRSSARQAPTPAATEDTSLLATELQAHK